MIVIYTLKWRKGDDCMFDREYYFYGKYADIVKRLTKKLNDEIGAAFFERNLDVYEIAPIIGWVYQRKATSVRDENTTKIFRDKMIDDRPQLLFNYRNLMLLEYKDQNAEERMNIAFQMDDKDDERKPYDELYNSYVLGGLEILDEKIFENASEPEEYLKNFYEFMQELQVRIYGSEVVLE